MKLRCQLSFSSLHCTRPCVPLCLFLECPLAFCDFVISEASIRAFDPLTVYFVWSAITQWSAFHQDGVLLWSSLWVKWLLGCEICWMYSRHFIAAYPRRTVQPIPSLSWLLLSKEFLHQFSVVSARQVGFPDICSLFCRAFPAEVAELFFLRQHMTCTAGSQRVLQGHLITRRMNGRSAEKAHQMLPGFHTPQAMVPWPHLCSMVRNLTGSKNLLLLCVHSAFGPRTQKVVYFSLYILSCVGLRVAWPCARNGGTDSDETLSLSWAKTEDLQMCVDVCCRRFVQWFLDLVSNQASPGSAAICCILSSNHHQRKCALCMHLLTVSILYIT